jgi:hypothetical protein
MMRRAYNSPPEAKSEKSVNSSDGCRMCGGTGWRLFMIDMKGDRRVCRCECRGPYTKGPGQMAQIAIVDYKSLAAGEQ